MRGRQDPQVSMLAFVDLETRVPLDHPLRTIKRIADEALASMSPLFDALYAEEGRPSIPPERLLKASLLMSLYSVRSERAFCEELDYHLLFRWFLGMDLVEPSFDHSTFSKNRERLLGQQVSREFFGAVVLQADRQDLLSDEHFSVDGTLIGASDPKTSRHHRAVPTAAARVIAGSTSMAKSARIRRTRARPIRMLAYVARGRARKPSSATWAMRSWRIGTGCWWTSK
jgi:transposase